MQVIYDWVKNIVIYLILVTVIMNLLGKSSYKKYIKLFTGMLLIVIVITPILKLCKKDGTFSYYFDTNNFVVEAEDISGQISDMEEGQNESIIKEYKNKIKDQIKQLVEAKKMYFVDAEIDIVEDKNEVSYGAINSINLTVSYNKEDDKISSDIALIEKINIDKIEIDESTQNKDNKSLEEKDDQVLPSVQEIQIKNSIADFYNISVDNINISIQEQ